MIAAVSCSGKGPSHVQEAALRVQQRVNKFEKQTHLRPCGHPPVELEWSDVLIDSVLGTGSFSVVYRSRVRRLEPQPQQSSSLSSSQRTSSSEQRFALKALSSETVCCNQSFVTGAIDLALEAAILSRLSHENVIQLHGIKSGPVGQAFAHGGFMIVLDLLDETLDARLEQWRKEHAGSIGWWFAPLVGRKRKSKARLEQVQQRMQGVVLGICRGMEYIHSQHVLLRDLKPNNIGFKDGKVKIFDFGLARELDPPKDLNYSIKKSSCSTRCNTGIAGTLRYISPENALGKPCGLPSDVYSFAIVLWEILTLQVPFGNIKLVTQFKEQVLKGHARPSLKYVPSSVLQDLLQSSWHFNPEERPTFSELTSLVEGVVDGQLLTQDGAWRKFRYKTTKPVSRTTRRGISPRLTGSRLFSGSSINDVAMSDDMINASHHSTSAQARNDLLSLAAEARSIASFSSTKQHQQMEVLSEEIKLFGNHDVNERKQLSQMQVITSLNTNRSFNSSFHGRTQIRPL